MSRLGHSPHLALKRAVASAGIHLFPLHKFPIVNLGLKLIFCQEEIIFAMLLFPRGDRLVADMENLRRNPGSCIRRFMIVDFPVPEGADSIIILPFICHNVINWSKYIEHLLLHLLKLVFHPYNYFLHSGMV